MSDSKKAVSLSAKEIDDSIAYFNTLNAEYRKIE